MTGTSKLSAAVRALLLSTLLGFLVASCASAPPEPPLRKSATAEQRDKKGATGYDERAAAPGVEVRGSVRSSRTERMERYPTMECPDRVAMGRDFALLVSLTEDRVTPEVRIVTGEEGTEGRLVLELPAGMERRTIDVILSAPGFAFVEGSNRSELVLPNAGDSTPALFRLRAKRGGKAPRDETVYATFWHRGTFLAKTSRRIEVVNTGAAIRSAGGETVPAPPHPADRPVMTAKVEPEKLRPESAEMPALMDFDIRQADLTVYVIESLDPARPEDSEIIISSPFLQPTVHSYRKPAGEEEWIKLHYNRFAGEVSALYEARGEIDPAAREAARLKAMALLRGAGSELYRRFAPEPFKEAFWRLSDRLGPRFRTIQVYTNNPLIPWELMRPERPSDLDGRDGRDFLGLEFTMGRWHVAHRSAQLDRPPQSLPLRELVVVAPGYREEQSLAGQSSELEVLKSFRGYRQLPGRIESIEGLFRSYPQGIVHFAGHGRARPTGGQLFEYFITLEDGELDLTTLRGLIGPPDRERHPFFFFNACEIGQANRAADFVNGWAPTVLEAGASGFVGALWPVDDQAAAEFAAYFYRTLNRDLQNGPVNVADLLRDSRKLFLERGNPTFLSFIFYGDPNLRIVQ